MSPGAAAGFNLAQGAIGCAVGIGASISTTAVGLLADTLGSHTAFLAMAAVAALAVVLTALAMPETRPRAEDGGGGAP